jgi:tetratricopeptide (TPR) repeat protein
MKEDLLARLQAAQSDEEREWLVLELSLSNLPAPVREAVWAAAIPHWFDAAYLAALLADPDLTSLTPFGGLEALTSLSFVEPLPGRGYNVHERTQTLLRDRLWQTDRERYRDLSHRAANYCADQDQDDTGWRAETIFHLLVAEPDAGATALQNTGWEWQNPPNFAYDQVESLARLARRHVDGNRLNDRGRGWTLFWEAHIDRIYYRNLLAKEKLLQIDVKPERDHRLAADTIQALGDVHQMLSEYEAARGRYEEALPIYQTIGDRLGEANTIQALGDVHQMLDEYEAARGRYEEALPIYQTIGARLGEANTIKALGDVHQRLSEYEAARGRYEEALSVFRIIGSQLGEMICWRGLADLERIDKKWEEADQKYQQALAFYRESGMVNNEGFILQRLGLLEQERGHLPAARTYYEAALELFTRIGSPTAEEVQADLDSLSADE